MSVVMNWFVSHGSSINVFFSGSQWKEANVISLLISVIFYELKAFYLKRDNL